jgi:hypothetical protein
MFSKIVISKRLKEIIEKSGLTGIECGNIEDEKLGVI